MYWVSSTGIETFLLPIVPNQENTLSLFLYIVAK